MIFLAYSDIHHDKYTNGITLNDLISVEDEITQYALQNNIKTVFFLGDWYRATNPIQEVIVAAEAAWQRRCAAGITTYVLVGNHDRWTKATTSGHSFSMANVFKQELDLIKVISEPREINVDDVLFFFIPAGYENDLRVSNYTCDNNVTSIVMFHGLLTGSSLAHGGGVRSGIHPNKLQDLHADLILGGDNHTFQRLDDILNCTSMYLGAPLQHNWGDKDQTRGFWIFNVDANSNKHSFSMVPSNSPRFVRASVSANTEIEAIVNISKLVEEKLQGRPGILEITLIGKNANTLDQEVIRENMCNMNVRSLKLIIDKTFKNVEISATITAANTPEDKWSAFVVDNTEIKDLNQVILSDIGRWALSEARKQI